jgi:N-acetylmuramoyl-L-alanine amidase
VLAYALALRDTLTDRGYAVIMTRASKTQAAPLMMRPRFSDNCDALISLHCDAFGNPEAQGNHCIFADNEQSENLGYLITKAIAEVLGLRPRRNIGNTESGGKAVLSGSRADASVLVECGFLSNANDFEKLTDDKAPLLIAQAIADALGVWAQDA